MKMLTSLILTLLAWGAAPLTRRAMTHDSNLTAIKYRMNAGFAGDVNRVHPFSVEASMNDPANAIPMDAFGQFGIVSAAGNTVRKIVAADQSDAVSLMAYGVSCRPFPAQQTSGGMTASFSSGTPPAAQIIDLLRWGYMMVTLNDVTATPKKGDPVYVWCQADNGVHKQGGIEAVASGGNTVKLANAQFNGAGDPSGNVEIRIGDRLSL